MENTMLVEGDSRYNGVGRLATDELMHDLGQCLV